MSEETLIAVLGLLHAIVGLLVGYRVYQCAVQCDVVRPSEEDV